MVCRRFCRLVCWLIDWSFVRRSNSRLFRLDDVGLGLVSKVRGGEDVDLRFGSSRLDRVMYRRRSRVVMYMMMNRSMVMNGSMMMNRSPGLLRLAGASEEVDEGTGEVTDEAAQQRLGLPPLPEDGRTRLGLEEEQEGEKAGEQHQHTVARQLQEN